MQSRALRPRSPFIAALADTGSVSRSAVPLPASPGAVDGIGPVAGFPRPRA